MAAFFIPYSVNTGKFNMDYDEYILNTAIEKSLKEPVLRFYGWSPVCVSLGRNQSDNHINKDFCKYHKIDIVKRITGGRALLHDNELTYSFVCPVDYLSHGTSVMQSYKEISGALALGFKKAGIDTDFPKDKNTRTSYEYCMSLSTGADLSFNGKKLVGSAQCRKQNYILQHGSVMFDFNAELIQNIFSEMPEKSKIITINEITPDLEIRQLCEFLKSGFWEYFDTKFNTEAI